MALLSFADSLREWRDLVARHPDRNPDHKRSEIKPWLSSVGAKPFISYLLEHSLIKHKSNEDLTRPDPSSRLSSPSPSFEFNLTQHYFLVRVIQDICPGLPISDCNIIIINTQPVARCRSCCSSISVGVPAMSVILV